MEIETLEMKATLSFETSENTYPAKQRNNPDDQNLWLYLYENISPHNFSPFN
jgi:hypothetical protein